MKYIAAMALMLNLGVATVYAQHQTVKMPFSGTGAPSTVNLLQPNASNSEENYAGYGTLGQFTFRDVRAIPNSPQPVSTCSGPNKIAFLGHVGGAVLRFQDGSLLNVSLTQSIDCIDFSAAAATCFALSAICRHDWLTSCIVVLVSWQAVACSPVPAACCFAAARISAVAVLRSSIAARVCSATSLRPVTI